MKRVFLILASLILGGCVALPEGIEPITGFDLERYLGTWHEIARLDHRFERGLSRVTADYYLRKEGGIGVKNRGFDAESGAWKVATGRAYLMSGPNVGRLKVSFFRPFYGSYNIIALDRENYRWAMICGPHRDYLWILAREPVLDERTLARLIEQAGRLGFATEELIMVVHD